MVWVLISASFSTFTSMSPRCPSQPLLSPCIPLFPARSSFTAHIPSRRGFSVLFLPIACCISSFSFCAFFFPLVIAACTSFLQKKIYIYIYENNTVVGSETLGIGPCKVGREFLIFITGLWYLLVALAHGVTVPWGREVRDPSPLPTGNAMGSLPAAPRSWSQSN